MDGEGGGLGSGEVRGDRLKIPVNSVALYDAS